MGWVRTSGCLALVLGHEQVPGVLAAGTMAIVSCSSGLDGAGAPGAWLHVLSRKLLERCSKSCGEGSLLLLPSHSPAHAWAPVSPLPWAHGRLLSRLVPGCLSLSGAATIKPSCPFLVLPVLRKPSDDTFLQGSTDGCCPLEMPPPQTFCPSPPCPPHAWWESCDGLCPEELLV